MERFGVFPFLSIDTVASFVTYMGTPPSAGVDMQKATHSVASRTRLIVSSNFSNYDLCLNPYVGCEFGCTYCYVRWFIKDDDKEWGEFVRVRHHLADKLPKELQKGYTRVKVGTRQVVAEDGTNKSEGIYENRVFSEQRLVIGTMTDPYQPAEKKYGITRTALEILTAHPVQFQKVGIFTRSPLVLRDLNLIKQLPKARVHFTVTPFPKEVMRAIEPYSPLTETRWRTIEKIQDAGIRCQVNIAPVIPGLSERFIDEFTQRLADLGVSEYFVDSMQPYSSSFESFKEACRDLSDVNWSDIERIMLDKEEYNQWKATFSMRWDSARRKHPGPPEQLPIWMDHETHTRIDMRTMQSLDWKHYSD